MIKMAREFGVLALVFFTSGVSLLDLMLHHHKLLERDNIDAARPQPQGELAIPNFSNLVPLDVLPNVVLYKEWGTSFHALCERAQGSEWLYSKFLFANVRYHFCLQPRTSNMWLCRDDILPELHRLRL